MRCWLPDFSEIEDEYGDGVEPMCVPYDPIDEVDRCTGFSKYWPAKAFPESPHGAGGGDMALDLAGDFAGCRVPRKPRGKGKRIQKRAWPAVPPLRRDDGGDQLWAPLRRCSHCSALETPQWRLGPEGPGTLCNACGLRYRSGRLWVDYRPLAGRDSSARTGREAEKTLGIL